MNKIFITDGDIKSKLDDSIKFELPSKESFFNVRILQIKICKNTNLQIEYTGTDEIKLEIYINILPNVKANIYEIKENGNYKLQYKYYLAEESEINVFKFNDATYLKEMTIINLNGEKSKFNQELKTISKRNEKYDLMIYHNASNSKSIINNMGINILDGKLGFNVSGFVPNGIKNCELIQKNRIINETENLCIIKPNLFIDEEDVSASHSALIGKIEKETLFYLMSKGISENNARKLVIKGLLLKNMSCFEDKIEEIIDSYWR